MDDFATYEPNDNDFVSACKNADYFTKRRCLKKMTKIIWRNGNSRPPADVEAYVKHFCYRWRDKQ